MCITAISDTVGTILSSKFRKQVMESGCFKGEMLFVAIAALITSQKMPSTFGVVPVTTPGGPTIARASQENNFLDSPEIQKVFSDYHDTEGYKWKDIYNKSYLELNTLDPELPNQIWRGVSYAMSIRMN